jgi:predicted transcriptional regulator
MSAQALIWAANVRGLKPATKIVLIQLSERHNKDTGMCNPSIKTLADDCEMDRTTVMRHIEILTTLGLLSRSATGKEDGGRANNEYVLHMPKPVETDVSEGVKSEFATGVKSEFATGVKSHSDGGLSRIPTGVKSHSCATRTLREPVKENLSLFGSIEPQSAREAEKPKSDGFDDFWKVYPSKKGKDEAQAAWAKAIKRAPPEIIIAAAKRYADWLNGGRPGEFRPNVKFAQGWLNASRWKDYPAETSAPTRARFQPPSHEEVFR